MAKRAIAVGNGHDARCTRPSTQPSRSNAMHTPAAVAAAVAAALALCLPAAAQRPTERPAQPQRAAARGIGAEALQLLLAKYDADKDGRITRKEYPRTDEAFANLDRDRDGAIDAKDLDVAPQRPAAQAQARRAEAKLPKVGDPAPDFALPMLGMKDTEVKLSSFAGDRPVALIFGSYT